MNLRKPKGVTDLCIMIFGWTLFSFTYIPEDVGDGAGWLLVIFNQSWEHNC